MDEEELLDDESEDTLDCDDGEDTLVDDDDECDEVLDELDELELWELGDEVLDELDEDELLENSKAAIVVLSWRFSTATGPDGVTLTL